MRPNRPPSSKISRPARNRAGSSRSKRGPPPPAQSHLIYGLHTVRAALNNPARKNIALFATPNALERLNADRAPDEAPPVELVPPKDLDRMVGTEAVHQGVVLKTSPLPRPDLSNLQNYRLVMILDQITDPHNVGAILRTACAFGADAVVTTTRHAPRETGVLAKSASGALDLVPFIEVNNLGEAIKTLKKNALWVVGFDSEADLTLTEARDTVLDGRAIAIVLGAEGKGLRHKTRQLCDQMMRLDMPGPIKSLNVSNAAAIALFALNPR